MLSRAPEGGSGELGSGRRSHVELVDDIIQLYGVRSFLADLDAGREYWREFSPPTVISESLSRLVEDDFEDFFKRHELEYSSAHEFRSRYLLESLKTLINVVAKRRWM